MWQEEFDVFLATGKDLVVNALLKEQGIKILLMTGSLRKMENMSVISVRENMKGLDMNVINVNTKKAICKSDITKHKQAKHEGVKYECNQCENKST